MWRPTRTEFDGHVNSVLYISPAGTADSIDILVYFPDVIFLYTLVSMLRQLGSRDGTTLMCNIKKPLLHITVISGHEKIKQLHNIESSSSIKYILRQNSHTRLDEIICIYSTDWQTLSECQTELFTSVPQCSQVLRKLGIFLAHSTNLECTISVLAFSLCYSIHIQQLQSVMFGDAISGIPQPPSTPWRT